MTSAFSVHDDLPRHNHDECIVWSTRCCYNCDLPEDAKYTCSKGLQCLGHFETVEKAKERIQNHCQGACHGKRADDIELEIDAKIETCIRGSVWTKEEWADHVKRMKAEIEKRKARAKRGASDLSAGSMSAPEPTGGPKGPYTKPSQPAHAPPPSRMPAGGYGPAARVNAPSRQREREYSAAHARVGAMQQLADMNPGTGVIQLGGLEAPPDTMTSKNVFIETLSKAEAGLRAAQRIAEFTAQAYGEEANNLARLSLSLTYRKREVFISSACACKLSVRELLVCIP